MVVSYQSYIRIPSVHDLADRLSIPLQALAAISQSAPAYYRRLEKLKPDGRKRVLFIPHGELKRIQTIVDRKLLRLVPVHDSIHSYRKGRGPLSNANLHIGNPYAVKLDIAEFFPSITTEKVFQAFLALGCTGSVARVLARLTTHNNQLPQGAPTSPHIANMVADRLAHRIASLSTQHNLSNGIYGDDIAVSGSARVARIKNLLTRIIIDEAFKVSPAKIQILGPRDRKSFTGFVVSDKSNVPKDEYRKVRAIVYNCQTKGPASQFSGDLQKAKARLMGMIARIHQVNPAHANRLRKAFNTINWE